MALILVIDDEPGMRTMIERMLKAGGHTVILAGDGDKGLQLFRTNQPDVVVTDIIMPQREGIETIREMRELNPSVRIIAVSGAQPLGGLSFLDIARKFGADAALQKPFRAAELLGAITSPVNQVPTTSAST